MKKTHPKQYNYCINKLKLGEVLDYIGVKYQVQEVIETILARYEELVELAKKYIEKGYKPIDAIKLAEKELEEDYERN